MAQQGPQKSAIIIPDEPPVLPLESLSYPVHYAPYISNVVIPYGLVLDRIERMAEEISQDLQASCDPEEGLHAICVLKGGFKFFTDLTDRMQSKNCCHKSLKISSHFIRARSYQNDQSTGSVSIMKLYDLEVLANKTVLVVEDIVDTGHTLSKLIEHLHQYKPKTIKVASLLLKRTPLHNGLFPDYVGFSVPNMFIVGYALDYNENFRDLKHICQISDEGKKKFANKPS
ncbi:hypothetical protein BOX15_Mlig001816g5 [Macrostomum lignano]|uniref:Uncharacterized protein n=2 Tax=Macrostomum lignano TaxID=282301 RepID=A0A267E7V8_9PLAT|nr:hypothetical protein BOX15_Mlig001816g5 [Macrostomum lignano]